MIFPRASLLQQDAALRVHHEDRERAVQEARPMHRHFAGSADRPVALVGQDQGLVRYCSFHCAVRFAALALSRSIVLATSTTKRPCVPRLISSSSSRTATSKLTLR